MSDEDSLNRESETEADAPETITLAREMGWKPEGEWKGEPPRGGFVTATEYVRRGEKVLPIVRAEARKAQDRVRDLEAKIERLEDDHRKNLGRIERASSAALEAQRLQITSQYAARKEAAVEVGDKDAYRQADKDEREAIKAIDDRLKEPEGDGKKDEKKAPEFPREVKETLDAWYDANPWFNSDEEMRALATARHMKLLKEKKGITLKENLEQVREYIEDKFPEHFGSKKTAAEDDEDDPPRRRGSPVEGGSRILGGGGGGSLWAKVPNADRQVAERAGHLDYFLKPGETLEKNKAQAQQRWAEKYFEGEKS